VRGVNTEVQEATVSASRHTITALLIAAAAGTAAAPAAQAMPTRDHGSTPRVAPGPPTWPANPEPISQPAGTSSDAIDLTAAGGAIVLVLGIGGTARIVARRRGQRAIVTTR
jgi:hypothetical protein